MLSFRTLMLGAASLAATASAGAAPPDKVPDLILTHGVVIPMTGPDTVAQAVAVKDGRIVAVGDDAAILKLRGKATRVFDLGGKTVVPGLIDAHGHITMAARYIDFADLMPPPAGKTASIAQLQAALMAQAASHPSGWIVGVGYDDAELAEKRHPTRQELDKVSADRPVAILHVSGHLATLNTRALEMLGLLQAAADPPGGVIRREADGKTASGTIEESLVFQLNAAMAKLTMEEQLFRLDKAQQLWARNGLTTAQDGATLPDGMALLKAAQKAGRLFIDVHSLVLDMMPWPERSTFPIGQSYQNHFRIAGVKLILDGSPQGRTAWLRDPVTVPPPGRDAHYHGYPQLTDDVLRTRLTEAADRGWQVYAHVNGDAAIQQLIEGIAAVDATRTTPMQRTIAIHAQTARTDQLQRMKALDIEPSFFASHTFYWGDWHREVALGAVRADRISPQREAIDIGLHPTIHNDSPVVPPDMARLIWSAVTRRTRSGDILGPTQRIAPYEALMEVTANAAYELHEEGLKGTIEPGKLADFAILDHNPLTMPRDQLWQLDVVATIKEGKTIFGNL